MYASLSSYTTFEKEKEHYSEHEPLLTFIIPSIGRPTLSNTIESLQRMENKDWKAIIVFDGVDPTLSPNDPRISVMKIDKTGINNYAGRVRNEGIRRATTKWVGFVDDDDTLKPTYTTRFYEHVKQNPDVIIFRMKNSDGRILPKHEQKDFFRNEVGISFCVQRTNFIDEQLWFEPSPTEDFDLLDRLRTKHKNIYISPHVEYIVR